MVKVITYGTYDLLHYGHIRLLERAKALGDYLIVGVTADDFDKTRGKINVQQSLMERIEAVRATGIADEIIIEEYEGQKIDDIKRYDVDIFTVGSDWVGKFDYLNEYCKVIYLERTQGVSSSELRSEKRKLRIGIIGETSVSLKFIKESTYVNGVEVTVLCSKTLPVRYKEACSSINLITENYEELLQNVEAVYVASNPRDHYTHIKKALENKKHVLCESPIALNANACRELFELAAKQECILMDGIKTAYSTAYERLLLLAKGGKVGKILSVDATCTSLSDGLGQVDLETTDKWNSMCAWGPIALLPIFQLLGTEYKKKTIISKFLDSEKKYDAFTKVDFIFPEAVASIKVAKAAKSEGELVITGTKGYFYVPAPWWKTDYFEIRYENTDENKRYFYQLDGEGIRYEIVAFARSIATKKNICYINSEVSVEIVQVIQDSSCENSDRIEI